MCVYIFLYIAFNNHRFIKKEFNVSCKNPVYIITIPVVWIADTTAAVTAAGLTTTATDTTWTSYSYSISCYIIHIFVCTRAYIISVSPFLFLGLRVCLFLSISICVCVCVVCILYAGVTLSTGFSLASLESSRFTTKINFNFSKSIRSLSTVFVPFAFAVARLNKIEITWTVE